MPKYVSAGLTTVIAAVLLVLVPTGSASAATALCTRAAGVVQNGNAISIPVASNGNHSCLIGRTQAANGSIVEHLQHTLKTCYPTVRLVSPYQNELVGNLCVDRNFGPRTHAAVKGVQARIGATADGVYGPMTRNLMRFVSNNVPTLCFPY